MGSNVETGFLAHLADDAGGERLAEFEHAAGERPVALEGLGAAADQKDAARVNDDCADADEGRSGKLAFDLDFHAISQFCHGARGSASRTPQIPALRATHPWGPVPQGGSHANRLHAAIIK